MRKLMVAAGVLALGVLAAPAVARADFSLHIGLPGFAFFAGPPYPPPVVYGPPVYYYPPAPVVAYRPYYHHRGWGHGHYRKPWRHARGRGYAHARRD